MLKSRACTLLLLGLPLGPALHSQPARGTAVDQFHQYVAQLQKTPNDDALRESIIKLASQLNPKPAVPDQVYELEGQGRYLVKNAKSDADFARAAEVFRQAALLAPWLPDYYFNQGVALEKAKQYSDAIRSFEWYVKAEPDRDKANQARVRIGELRVIAGEAGREAAERAAREEAARNAEAARAASERTQVEGWSGIWTDSVPPSAPGVHFRVAISGNDIDIAYYESFNFRTNRWGTNHACPWSWHGTISGSQLSLTVSRAESCRWTPRPPQMSWPQNGRINFAEQKIIIEGRDWDFSKGQWYNATTVLSRLR